MAGRRFGWEPQWIYDLHVLTELPSETGKPCERDLLPMISLEMTPMSVSLGQQYLLSSYCDHRIVWAQGYESASTTFRPSKFLQPSF